MFPSSETNILKTLIFTAMALSAFAANSVLCRLALGSEAIDAGSFTSIRLISGSVTLFLILIVKKNINLRMTHGSWLSSMMLFVYAVTFSFAYITLDTGTGALILFGSVQTTMILLSVLYGNRLHISEWVGILVAFGGFIYLIFPGISTPSAFGFTLMSLSGIAWGVYTLRGRGSDDPLRDTAYNFFKTIPFILVLLLIVLGRGEGNVSSEGFYYAVVSGGLTSGVGYSIWYIALKGLTATQAAVVQLSVPVIAAAGGVVFVSEEVTLRLLIATVLILGGILLVVLGRYYFSEIKTQKKQVEAP